MLISRVGTLSLKSQCYLVVDPTLCFLPAWITLVSRVSRNGSRGGILPCIPKKKEKKKRREVICSKCEKERKRLVFVFFLQTTSGNHSEDQGWLRNIYTRNPNDCEFLKVLMNYPKKEMYYKHFNRP